VKRGLVLLVSIVSLVATGCGVSSDSKQEDQNRWINQVGLILDGFKESQAQVLQQVKLAASSPTKLAAVYASYSTSLDQLDQALEGTDPPSDCRGMEKAVTDLIEQTRTLTAGLSSPAAVDSTKELLNAERQANAIEAAAQARLAPYIRQKHC
jgi:hypothetical protein